MNTIVRRTLAVFAVTLSLVLAASPATATTINRNDIKQTCSTAGGSYSEGSNYARCEYSNGDSYTCNTDVNKCESCTGGKCTVSSAPYRGNVIPTGPAMNAPVSQPSPTKPPMNVPATKPAPAKKTP